MSVRLDRRELQANQKMSRANIEALLETETSAQTSGITSLIGLALALSAQDSDPSNDSVSALGFLKSLAKEFFFISTATAYTTTGLEDLVVATAAVTVTLNALPDDGEKVEIKRVTTAGNVIIDGNGNTIDGAATFTLLSNYGSYDLIYSVTEGGWLII